MATDDIRNTRISFWNRINASLDTGTYGVKYEGLDFNTDAHNGWFEPKYFGFVDRNHRTANRSERHAFQVASFVRTGPEQSTPIILRTLTGMARDAFRDTTISIKDWDAAGNPHSIYMEFVDYEEIQIPEDDEHLLHIVSAFYGVIDE